MQGDLFGRAIEPAPAELEQPTSTADIEGLYRYSLTRTWNRALGIVCWVMLNPSKADATKPDPTMTRCLTFARDWGYGGIEIVNLFALRSTDPKALRSAADPVGPRNDAAILAAISRADRVVCAWGPPGTLHGRYAEVLRLLAPFNPHVLRTTKDGHPSHPLYLPASLRPSPWSRAA